jgi:hypothetical protein
MRLTKIMPMTRAIVETTSKVDERPEADTSHLFHVAHLRDADDHRAEDDRRDHHADQLHECVAERLHGAPVAGYNCPSATPMTIRRSPGTTVGDERLAGGFRCGHVGPPVGSKPVQYKRPEPAHTPRCAETPAARRS